VICATAGLASQVVAYRFVRKQSREVETIQIQMVITKSRNPEHRRSRSDLSGCWWKASPTDIKSNLRRLLSSIDCYSVNGWSNVDRSTGCNRPDLSLQPEPQILHYSASLTSRWPGIFPTMYTTFCFRTDYTRCKLTYVVVGPFCSCHKSYTPHRPHWICLHKLTFSCAEAIVTTCAPLTGEEKN